MRIAVCLPLIASMLAISGVNAAEIRVHVVDKQRGNSLAGASVCLGTPGNPVQFGGQVTPGSGYAVFQDVPQTPLVLTVSRPDYTGYQRTHSAKRFNITLRTPLSSGGLGPVCDLGDQPVSLSTLGEGALTVGMFRLENGASSTAKRLVSLNTRLSGNPTHYRVAEHWSFDGADWVEFEGQPEYELSEGAGQKKVYFQVRRLRGSEGAQVESVSGIAQATIYLTR